MNKNAFIGEHGELCNGVLLNIAEILTLRLPEGAGKGEKFDNGIIRSHFLDFLLRRKSRRRKVGQEVPGLRFEGLQKVFVAVH